MNESEPILSVGHITELIKAVQSDHSLSDEQKKSVVERLQDKVFVSKLSSGVIGGGVGLLVSKYLKLSNSAKVLLSVAGYGIGRTLWESLHSEEKKFQDYNKKLKVYEIRQAHS